MVSCDFAGVRCALLPATKEHSGCGDSFVFDRWFVSLEPVAGRIDYAEFCEPERRPIKKSRLPWTACPYL